MQHLMLFAACCGVCSPCRCAGGCPCPRFEENSPGVLFVGALLVVLGALLFRLWIKKVAGI